MPEEQQPDLVKKAIHVIVVGGSAASVALASGASPTVTLAAGAAASSNQAGDLVSSVWGSLRQRWNRNGQATLEAGAAAAEMDLEEFLQRLLSTPARQELLAAALEGGAHAELEAKIGALGSALRNGAITQDHTEVDRERLISEALAAIERPHVRLLVFFDQAHSPADRTYLVPRGLRELRDLPGLGEAVHPLLATLERHGMVERLGPDLEKAFKGIDSPGGPAFLDQYSAPRWQITPFGRECLDRLWTAGLEKDESTD